MPYVKDLRRRSLQLQAIHVDLRQKLGPVLVQGQVDGFHELILEGLRAAPHLPENGERVVDALNEVLLPVHEGLSLDLFDLRLAVDLVLDTLLCQVWAEEVPQGSSRLFLHVLVEVVASFDGLDVRLLCVASLRDQILRDVHLLHVVVRNVVVQGCLLLLRILCLLDHLIHGFVLIEALAVALETSLNLLVNVLNLFNDSLLQTVQLVLRVVLNEGQNLLGALTVLLVLLEHLVRALQMLADLRLYTLFAWHLLVVRELKHD